ncbi:MAG TPA: hypothetical protein VFT16_05125 [Candidatus Saccharimonadales bacterium]|nr:hypothetical protein [Candidatus Saccharimonadales bacterium]
MPKTAEAAPRIPKYARYNWLPISITLGLTAATLIGLQLIGGNRHGASNTPGVDTMPHFPVVYPTAGAPEHAIVPAKTDRLAAWVCRDFVFVDSQHEQVIVNPIVDPASQLPFSVADADATGIELAKPTARDNYIVYQYIGGKLVQDDANRLNRCYGDVQVTAVEVSDAEGTHNRYVLMDSATTIQEGDNVDTGADAALREHIVHAEYDMPYADIHAFVTGLQR